MALAEHAVHECTVDGASGSCPAPPRKTRPWRLVDRLGEKIILDLLADSQAGATKQILAQRYGMSLSSVKRILNAQTRCCEYGPWLDKPVRSNDFLLRLKHRVLPTARGRVWFTEPGRPRPVDLGHTPPAP
jgi:hypothetical protein